MQSKLKRVLTWLLYLLPVVFFGICYFLITATEEDIVQGAGTVPNVWNDLVAAFQNNARLSDMYAWAVINFFDYQYSFGIDTIFRLIDVGMAIGVLVLMASIILGKRPRWKLKDALVYMGCFLLLVLTPYGYTFYRGFSMAHNYLIIVLAMLVFGLPFVRKLSGGEVPKVYRKWWVAIPVGLIFGLSANFPPLAFLATYIMIKGWQWLCARKDKAKLKTIWPEAWEWMMIGGMLVSMLIGYVLGPGVSGYESDPMYTTTYDYVALGAVFQDLGGSAGRIVRHMVTNFGRTLAPIVIVLGVAWIVAWVRARAMGRKTKLATGDLGQRRLILGLVIFSGFVVLAGLQIIMPVRLCLPAYVALVIVAVVLIRGWWQKLSDGVVVNIGIVMVILAAGVIGIRAVFAWDFHGRIGEALQMIKEAESEVVCVNPHELQQRPKMPLSMFQQEETFVLRQENYYTIYEKKVTYCQE